MKTRKQRVGIVVSVGWLLFWLTVVPAVLVFHAADARADAAAARAAYDDDAAAVLAARAAAAEAYGATARGEYYVDPSIALAAGSPDYIAAAAADPAARAALAAAIAAYDAAVLAARANDYWSAARDRLIVTSLFIGILPLVTGWSIWWIRRA